MKKVKSIVLKVAVRQFKNVTDDDLDKNITFFNMSDQIMNFSTLGEKYVKSGASSVSDFAYSLSEIVSTTELSDRTDTTVEELMNDLAKTNGGAEIYN